MRLYILAALAVVTACSRSRSRTAPAPAQPTTSARAVLRLGDGREVGAATLQATPAGVLVTADLSGLPAGTHAMHFHTVGTCTGPDFASAGGHFNPATRSHGFRNAAGPHAGDLPNIHVPESGALRVEVVSTAASLGPGQGTLGDADGSAIVIHALADDYQTDPAGASGARIACGVIER